MRKLMLFIAVGLLIFAAGNASAAINYSSTAGDQDYAATRNAYDVTTNMDFYVFNPAAQESGAATNTKGWIKWNYVLPYAITTANSGSMTVRSWDIDSPGDQMNVYFKFGATEEFAGLLTGTNGGNVTTWESAVAGGTTASLAGWSTTTFDFSPALLAALSGSTGFELYLQVIQGTTESWAAVIDYATLNLNYEPGDPNPNPTPEPTTMLLLGLGVLGLAGLRKRD